jgi:3-hydroxybutyryl-CoA dehydratase
MLFINDLKIGDKASHSVLITQKMHDGFAELSGDDSPIHTDPKFCEKTKFKKPLGYAFLLTTILSKIYGTIYPGGSELCLSQTCEFKNPFYVNDTLNYNLEVIQRNESLKLVTIKTIVRNQDNKVVFKGEAMLQLSLGDNS